MQTSMKPPDFYEFQSFYSSSLQRDGDYSRSSTSASLQSPFNTYTESHFDKYLSHKSESQHYKHASSNDAETSVISDIYNSNFYSDEITTMSSESETSFSIFEQNIWEIFDEKYLRHNLGWTITLVVAYVLILIIGIIGNLMVILVVIKRPRMRTVTNMFIMNLAVADLFVVVFCVPATLISNIFTPWVLGWVMCKGVAYIQGVSVCASAYSLVAISLDRSKGIYRAFKRPRGLSKRQALLTILLIWTLSLLLIIPWAVYFDVVYFKDDGMSYCVETWENETHGKIYFLFANLFCCYCLPLILISISNVIIWCHVSKRKVPHDSASVSTIKKMHRRTRHGVRKMLGIVTLAFLLSWLPLYILVTRVKFGKNISIWESNLQDTLMPLAQLLGSLNSSINPILYAFLNNKFREMFKSLLPRWVPCVRRRNLKIVTTSVARATTTNGTYTIGSIGTPSHAVNYLPKNASLSTRNSNIIGCHSSQSCNINLKQRIPLVSSIQGHPPSQISIFVTEVCTPSTSIFGSRERLEQTVSFENRSGSTVTDV